MKNKILRVIRDSIPYVKELRPLTKSIASAVLMQQLDYWFYTYPDKFYKFMTTPDVPTSDYKEGDSWEEEIGISTDEFRIAFDNIGIRYKSKTEYVAAPNKFQGKFYCSYFDRSTRKTWYFRDHEVVDAALDDLTIVKTKKEIRQEKAAARDGQSQAPVNGQSQSTGNGQSQSTGNGQCQSTEVGKSISVNGQCQFTEVGKSISILYTEITTEITPEITTETTNQKSYRAAQKKSETILENSENATLQENSENATLQENSIISETKQEIGEEAPLAPLAPPEINAIAETEKSLAKPRPKKDKGGTLEAKRLAYAPFLEIYNRQSPDKWGKHEVLVGAAIKKLDAFTKQWGDRSIEIFEKGLLHAQTTKFLTQTVDWDLPQYMTNDKPALFAEKYDQAQARKSPFEVVQGDREMTAMEIKIAETYLRFKAALEKHEEAQAA